MTYRDTAYLKNVISSYLRVNLIFEFKKKKIWEQFSLYNISELVKLHLFIWVIEDSNTKSSLFRVYIFIKK